MGKDNEEQETKSKKIREWLKVLGTLAASAGIVVGVMSYRHKKEKEASDRLLHIIELLDSKNCRTVRAGAVSTMGVYLGDYEEYQDRALWVMANNLATEEDPLVRDNILNILKRAKTNAIEPLACMNRFLLKEEIRWQSSFLFDVDMVFQIDLDSGSISEELRKEFDNYKNSLSKDITISIVEKDSKWLINDKNNKKIYSIRKDEHSLGIYENDNVTVDESSSHTQADFPNPEYYFSLPEHNDNLSDTIKALVAALKNMKEKIPSPKGDKQYLQDTILSNFDLPSKINLDKINFEQSDFRSARLKGISLRQANLKQADLSNAILLRVDLSRAHLNGANLESALFVASVLEGAHLCEALLFSVDAMKFSMDLDGETKTITEDFRQEFENNGIYLSQEAVISNVEKDKKYLIFEDGKRKYRINKKQGKLNIYMDAILKKTCLEYINLRDADLTSAILLGARLMNADLRGANLLNADLRGASLLDADLRGANLLDADLADADLLGARLMNADLRGANLLNADLTDADLLGADFSDSNLKGVNIRKARNWQKAIFDNEIREKF